jgi:hypothetical protein
MVVRRTHEASQWIVENFALQAGMSAREPRYTTPASPAGKLHPKYVNTEKNSEQEIPQRLSVDDMADMPTTSPFIHAPGALTWSLSGI